MYVFQVCAWNHHELFNLSHRRRRPCSKPALAEVPPGGNFQASVTTSFCNYNYKDLGSGKFAH
jgi:hypothetical protein